MMAASFRLGTLPLIAVFLAADTATQIAFKAAATQMGDYPISLAFAGEVLGSPYAWLAALCYLATYVLWIAILQGSALANAFPLTALSYVTVPVGAWLIFGEAVSLKPAIGIALICAGVALIGQEEAESVRSEIGETTA